jgi:cytochrome b involved in lipid metabolism
MITYRTLLLGVLGIGIVMTSAYAFIAPRLSSTEEYTPVAQSPVEYESEREIEVEPEIEIEVEEENEKGDDSVKTASVAVAPVVPLTTGYTLSEVALHANEKSCWTAVSGKVYDLTPFLTKHPGGKTNIMKLCGKEGTAIFTAQHEGDAKPESRLESLYIGTLVQ